jgi:hypothetical protein
MATIEMVEKLRERARVSYEDAKLALDACGGDMLEAVIYLEKQGKTPPPQGGFYASGGAAAEGGAGDGEYEFGSGYASNGKARKYKASRANREHGWRERPRSERFRDESRWRERHESQFSVAMKELGRYLGKALHFCNSTMFEVKRNGSHVINLPLTVLALALIFIFQATVIALVVGLLLGFRYRFSCEGAGSESVNSILDSAADAADAVKGKAKSG